MTETQAWGRLLIAGGTDFATLGRKDKSGKSQQNLERPELLSPNIMRSVANIKFTRVFTSHSGCHAVVLSLDKQAYLIGRNEHYQLSHPLPTTFTTPHLSTEGIPAPTPAAGFPFPLRALPDSNAPQALKKQNIVHAAVGRGHTVLVTESGEAWTAGWNNVAQCGHEGDEHLGTFKRVGGELKNEKVVQASAGINFSVFLCENGKVYTVGSGEKGVLGNGRTGEHIAKAKVLFIEQAEPYHVRGALENKKIVQITSGQQHTVALDDEGYCYAWGFGGLGRLGTGTQKDELVPVVIPQFAGSNPFTRCRSISAGAHCTLFIDAQGMIDLCGRWKTSGDGSSGQPWMTPKLVQDIMGYKWDLISSGGVTLFAHTNARQEKAGGKENKDGVFTCAWGQSAIYGELAFGPGHPKSATKPQRVDPLDAIELLDIAAGQNTTFFIARPPALPADLAAFAATSSSPTPPPPVVAAAEPAPKPAGGVDLSGFGFSFMPSSTNSPAATPPPPPVKEVKDANAWRPSSTEQGPWEELPRYPMVLDATDVCLICRRDDGPEEPLECEMCENAFHGPCLTPPIFGLPDGEWFCPTCSKDDSASIVTKAGEAGRNLKRQAEEEEQDDGAYKRQR